MEILIYIGKVSLYWVLFYLCYQLLLRRHTFFHWNRFYLLGSMLVSLALPFLSYPESAPKIPVAYQISAQAVSIVATSSHTQSLLTWQNAVGLIYFIGLLYASIRLFRNIRQLRGFLAQGEQIELDDCTVVLIDSNMVGSFSFLQWIVVNRHDYEHNFDAILRHEMVHRQQRHTLDILIAEVIQLFFWFNPVIFLYKKSLQEIHEFLADAQAPNRETYATFLVQYALNAPITTLTNHFFKASQIKTRIQMIYKNRTSKWLLSTYMVAIVMIGTVAMIIAGCEKSDTTESAEANLALAEQNKIGVDVKKVYSVVEDQPEFPGGVKAMYEFIGDNIKYPEAAAKANVEGRVFLSFVVSETGEVSDIKVLKGIGYGCDTEAVRVLKKFPNWKPGKQNGIPVNVRYNLPINFQLEEKESATAIDKQFKNPDGSVATLTTSKRVIEESNKTEKINVRITGNKPLYVVDGKIEEDPEILKKIPAEKIESVNVLKDEPAIAAYGKKGEQGVIQITTKKI